jgi:hypothetical protein
MKKHLSSLLFGCLGLCAGFTLCYVYLVLPERTPKATAPSGFIILPMQVRTHLDWQPLLIYPMIPPKIVGR